MTLNQKHTLEMALRNAENLLWTYNKVVKAYTGKESDLSNELTASFNNALDTLQRIEITESKQHIEEVIDLTTEIKNNSNSDFKEDELHLSDVQQ